MGALTIHFVGICTHVIKEAGVPHRVVLIREMQPVTLDGYLIEPHVPDLEVDGNPIALPDVLHRVRLEIANTVGEPPQYDGHFNCAVLSLRKIGGESLRLDRSVAVEGQPPAGVYFDITHGSFSATRVSGGGTAGRVVIETADDDPTLVITPIDGGESRRLPIPTGSVLYLSNDSHPKNHDDADFLLHYKAMDRIPGGAPFPKSEPRCPGLPPHPRPGRDIGPGCSNSRYP